MWKNVLATIRERKFYYLGAYVIGLLAAYGPASTYAERIYPINLYSLSVAIIVGSIFYYSRKKVNPFLFPVRILKYIVFISLLIAISTFISITLKENFNIDISPFIGL